MRLMKLLPTLTLFLLAVAVLPAADDKKPVPKADAQAAVEKLVKELFKDDYAKTAPADKLALAAVLFQQGQDTKDDPAARYVLFRESATLAAQAGNLREAFKAIEELTKEYAVSGGTLKGDVLEKAAAGVTAADAKAFVELALPVVDESIASDDFDAALRIAKAAETAAKKASSVPLVTQTLNRQKDVEKAKASFAVVQTALETLKTKADDPAANLTVGKHYCFVRGDWPKGLPLLVKSSDAKIKPLAQKDLDVPTTAAAQIELADGWYDLAATETAKLQLQLRAHRWYKEALPAATGLTKTKVEKRLTELDKLVGTAAGLMKTYLSDIQEIDAKVGYGKFGKKGLLGYGPAGTPITVNGKKSENGLSTAPPSNGYSTVKYRLGKTGQSFEGAVAYNDKFPNDFGVRTAVTFKVLGDGKELWASKPVQTNNVVQQFKIAVTGVDVIELQVHCHGDLGECRAVWIDPFVMVAGKIPVDDGRGFVGQWVETGGGFTTIWTIALDSKGQFSVTTINTQNGKTVGNWVGKDVKFAAGKLTFIQTFIKKANPIWADNSLVTLTLAGGDKINYTWQLGGSSGDGSLTRGKK